MGQLVPQLIQPRPRLINIGVDPRMPGVGEGFVTNGDPQPMQHPSELVVILELVSVIVGGQLLDAGEEGVEFEKGVPIGSNVAAVHTG
ncbi:MAG: hypothetical protein M3Y77_04300 [Actinomycetota bacterium]|nr:hypothetical protein [Actinomycetota bacterium]